MEVTLMSDKQINYFTVQQLDEISGGEGGYDFTFLYSTRSDGKSYAVKSRCLMDAYASIKDGICYREMAYMRRYDLDNRDAKITKYFADMPIQEITEGKYTLVTAYRKDIYFGNMEKGKVKREVKIGSGFSIGSAEHDKSLMSPHIQNIIFEEVTALSGQYLYNEPTQFLHAISTIARDRENVKVYLIGNIISRQCPYFDEWQLHPEKLKEGESNIVTFHDPDDDIETKLIIYHIKPSGTKSKLFFGRAKDNITKGEYFTELQKHLKCRPEKYPKLHTVVLEYDSFKYLMDFIYYTDYEYEDDYAWFIQPKTTEIQKGTRVVTNTLTHGGKMVTDSFRGLSDKEDKAFSYLFDRTKVFFSDNLTGTEFYNIINNFK